jgi:hypothetical protein
MPYEEAEVFLASRFYCLAKARLEKEGAVLPLQLP